MSAATDLATILAAINAKFGATTMAFAFGDPAVASLSRDHILVMATRRYVPAQRESGEVVLPGGRAVTRYIAVRAANINTLRERTAAALEDQILAGDLGPFTFETADPPDQDGTWTVSTDTWTF